MTVGERIRTARTARRPRWSQARLADELSLARWGVKGRCHRQQIYRWEAGKREPRDWAPWIEKVLDIDLAADTCPPGSDTVASAVLLGRSDVERRRFLTASAAVGMSALEATDYEAITRRVRRAGPVTVGMGEVAAIRYQTTQLGNAASELGGRHARSLAVRYLTEDVERWLNGNWTESTGRELYAAASQLVHLIGWMARDAGLQGLAQHYHLYSYRLAAEAGENELAATALRGLADQAIDLGHVPTAVRLAEACEQRGRKLNNSKALAYYRNTYARAAAADGDRATAARQLAASQAAIEDAPARPGESWASHYSPGRWAHESGMIHAKMGDWLAAEEHLHLALDIHGLDRRRTRAIVLADLGHIQFKRGNAAQAVESWSLFLDCAEGVQSVRVDDAVTDLSARLPQLDTAVSQNLAERISAGTRSTSRIDTTS